VPTWESNKKPACALICVGSELLRGKINTHAASLARRLASIGLELTRETTVADDAEALTASIAQALSNFDVVFVTGGLGPTFDDLTREAAAAACGRPLRRSPKLLAGIAHKFKKARYLHMPPANARQADLIEGAEPIENSVGTAPGQWLATGAGSQRLILLPGPPSELNPMCDDFVMPRLRRLFPVRPQEQAHLHFVGVPESVVDHRLRPLIEQAQKSVRSSRGMRMDFTILAYLGLVDFDLFVSAPARRTARQALRRLVKKIRTKMGGRFYGMDKDYPLQKVVGDLFRRKRISLAAAESCTGGLLSARLTEVAGSSDFFRGGVVSYSNALKRELLGVSEALLKKHGAVSRQSARAMAEGARRAAASDWSVSITGIAGPSGASATKPVGLVYIALSGAARTQVRKFLFHGSREAIRERAVTAALDLLRRV